MKVDRILAPNPGPMTGPGTNTWVVASAGIAAVIDPGPAIPVHLEAVEAALEGLVPVAVVVTHGHEDHAPGAAPLAARLGVPVLGPAGDPGFSPDAVVADGDGVDVGAVRLIAVATPGHTADSTCYQAGDALFTGDHIMGGSTVMVSDMQSYLDSLRRVQALRPRVIYPGHGPAITDPERLVVEYLAHRLAREAEILAAVHSGARTVGDVVAAVYSAVDPALHPAAAVSVDAHLRKLACDGLVSYHGGGWHGAGEPAP